MRMKIITLMFVFAAASLALVGPLSANAQVFTTRANTRQIQNLLNRIETRTDTFRRNVDSSLDRSRLDNTNREDRIAEFITEFENATDALRTRFNSRQDVSADVTEVLNRAVAIDRFMNRNRLSAAAENNWRLLRTDLNTLAGYHQIVWDWNRTTLPGGPAVPVYTVSDPQLRNLLTRIETSTDRFKNQMDRNLDRPRWNNTTGEDAIATFISDFENATDRLKTRFDARESTGADVSEVLTRAQYIDRFMNRNRFPNAITNQWGSLRTDLNTLASYYRVAWNWNQPVPPFTPGGVIGSPGGVVGDRFDRRLTGTYRLNRSQSDNVSQVIDRSLGFYNTGQRDRVRNNLERRLNSPEMLAIDMNNRTVTIASNLLPQVTFEVDGTARTETNARGRTISTTATTSGDSVAISYEGERTNDFYLTFTPVGNDQLRVTRRIYLENRNDQVTVTSVYDKIDRVAQWSTVNRGGIAGGPVAGGFGDFYIPNGARLTAELRNAVNTRATQPGDRFTMEVTSPIQYRGAIIEGRIANVDTSGRLSGRANVSFDFDSIRMPNGQSYRFAGIIDSVRTVNGENVSVTNEGTVRDTNQTTRTVTRAGIGAALGALIGAIAGGGEGAAIGAAVGAGAGAGTVLIQGRDNVELGQGTEFTITATAPNTVGGIR